MASNRFNVDSSLKPSYLAQNRSRDGNVLLEITGSEKTYWVLLNE